MKKLNALIQAMRRVLVEAMRELVKIMGVLVEASECYIEPYFDSPRMDITLFGLRPNKF